MTGIATPCCSAPRCFPARAAGQLLLYTWIDGTLPDLIEKFEAEKGHGRHLRSQRDGFMAFMLKPENSALSSNFTHYASGLGAAPALYDAMKASPELRVPDDVKVVLTPACPETATKLMDRVWTRLKK